MKDCRKCIFCTEVLRQKRYFCRKLGMVIFPQVNGSSPCIWYKEEADEEAMRDLPDLWP
jgi:hypothetical protein